MVPVHAVEIERDTLAKVIVYMQRTIPPCTLGEAVELLAKLQAEYHGAEKAAKKANKK